MDAVDAEDSIPLLSTSAIESEMAYQEEKGITDALTHIVAELPSPTESDVVLEEQVDHAFEAKVLRKVDLWLVGFYSLVYIFRVIDSSNYSNAAIINLEHGTGIKKQLHLNPSQWAWTLSIFSYSYMIFEPTNTVLLKTFRPSRWMFVLILAWGICACSVAAVQNFQGMMCARFAIGLAEAGFFPAVLYHMAYWYKPTEMPWRIAFFYSVGPAVERPEWSARIRHLLHGRCRRARRMEMAVPFGRTAGYPPRICRLIRSARLSSNSTHVE